ncbi:glycoside hydrolase family 3 N-terminal domain-containing protein [Halocynthiibacter namhaensis]|uniref:glycoside hydrolase family 3 N-terminal domain-containing protein n=1 Tax=Halocynthiibacter namhaensis TaxID=1290553 RepID=UPI00057960BE|nr:glycoside hydrolase family 3 N-terminal domain-containing protein [Halocynthiibacter namhaensis]
MTVSTATGAYIFGCSGQDLLPEEAAFFRETRPLGFILFARNLVDPDQIRRLTDDLRLAAGHDAMVLIDQEGGRVERMSAPHWSTWISPLDQVRTVRAAYGADAARRSMYLRYQVIAAQLLASGIDVNCVPCSDVAHAETHPVLYNRCYGEDLETVVDISKSVAQAHLDAGALPVVKHMPGHGRATLDSHLELPSVSADHADLDQVDFAAFRALSDLPLGMSAHIVYEALGQTGPATTSHDMIRLIRDDIGFGGLLMTDDLSMQALDGTVAQRSQRALAAGCDVILHCNGEMAEMQGIAKVSGGLSDAACRRAVSALALRENGVSVDISAAIAELKTLL